ncbi:SSI family serine proteinase inhibitor [Streptomyces sp. NBC_00328]|uniref:SSI family serine proteinase inhibitor n=1 Tax=Streptomyces sp. NBC_00328 TaxID=2903646 RepID=UPI002E2883ED|nr:SSI family serine proteinase inhibitor [Streptomyces sp. NBC_00328]
MTTTLRAIRAGLLVPLALLLAGAAPAAHGAPGHGLPGNWLRLAVTRGDARVGDAPGVLLLCDPPRGHAHAAQACRQLAAAGGDIGRIRSRAGAMCPMLYAPVTASAHGAWDGRRVDYTHAFSNSCVMGAETGAVFDLSG